MSNAPVRPERLILVPALITLGVTLLRLLGELQDWSPALFGRTAGGGGSLVGIAWLVPVFGAWFGWKLGKAGTFPQSFWRALALAALALAILPLSGFLGMTLGLDERSLSTLAVYAAVSLVGMAVAVLAWPALGRTLLVYALAARVPVVLVMRAAILGNWGTHYDVPPSADFPTMAPLTKWLIIGVVPQLTIWLWFTAVIGGLFGIISGAIARRGLRTT